MGHGAQGIFGVITGFGPEGTNPAYIKVVSLKEVLVEVKGVGSVVAGVFDESLGHEDKGGDPFVVGVGVNVVVDKGVDEVGNDLVVAG